ncbi:MAG: hypothetical protein JXM79_03340 [Sedimentisphaerales bacterium]|nr:hypothetical protein [Sedimentisphaerales bacterium]
MMDNKVTISIIGQCIHTEHWMGLYESLASNEVPFEIIFVGHKVPEFTLPDNFHFIYSEVKPAQCTEIASRYAVGEFIMNTGDDYIFSEHALDKMVELHRSYDCDKIMITARYILDGKDWTGEADYFWWGIPQSPRLGMGGLIKKSTWDQIGGVDRRFTALCWDIDIIMRLYEIGGAVALCQDASMEEIVTQRRLYAEFGTSVDRPLLDWLWVRHTPPPEGTDFTLGIHCKHKEKGVISRTRLSPFIPFEDRHLLTRSQGPKGRWR